MLEPLEGREVPAADVWLGGSGVWGTGANWSLGHAPVPVSANPLSTDVPTFDGTASNLGVTFPSDPTAEYAGFVAQSTYAGTLAFPAAVAFDSYQQYGGYTFQSTATATVTVKNTFTWTGGVINSSTNPATYDLKGVTAGQIGTDTTTLVSGAKFVFEKLGAVTSYVTQSGVLNLLNGGGIDVLEGATLDQRRINQNGAKPEVNGTDVVRVKGQTYTDGGKLNSVKVDGGLLGVERGGLEVTGKVPGTDWSVVVTTTSSGWIEIDDGATLKVAFGVEINNSVGVSLRTNWDTGAQPPRIATIDGTLRLNGGEIAIGSGMPNTESTGYSGLIVTENAELWGGTFQPYVCSATSSLYNYIHTKKKLDIKTAFTIKPQLLGSSPPANTSAWSVLESDLGFNDATNPTNGDTDHYTMDRSAGTTPTDWVVKPKPQ